tara:strand:+ start:3324 stop:4331 length:1008 start_codon:yes stop_codon:yes gene_type:complete
MELGQPKHLKQNKDGGGLIRTRLEEGDNVHRVLFGPVKISLQYYPTLVEDATTGEMVQRMKVIRRGNAGTPLDTLSSLEKRIRTGRGEQNASSSLNPSNKWLYLVMDKNDEDYPSVKIAEYPYTVYKKLIELEAAVSTKDSSKLRHGLIFMWDAIITKNVDKSKGIRFGTSYDVTVDPENDFSGKVPVSYLGASTAELGEKLDLAKFFTEDEYAVIQAAELDLEKEGAPHTAEEVKQLLADFPIYLGATNPDGSYRFPSIEQFQEQLEKMGIDFLSGEANAPQLESPKTDPVEIPTTKAEPVAEEVTEEAPTKVDEEKPADPDKKDSDDEDFPEW